MWFYVCENYFTVISSMCFEILDLNLEALY